MSRTNFERLRVYQRSEKLADQIWQVVLGGTISLGIQLESRLCDRPIALEPISPKVQDVDVTWIISGLFEWRAALSMKHNIGSDELINANS